MSLFGNAIILLGQWGEGEPEKCCFSQRMYVLEFKNIFILCPYWFSKAGAFEHI